MSGPVSERDADAATAVVESGGVEVLEGRRAEVGGMPVTRLLPKRAHRTVGAWCFLDHFGPVDVADAAMQVGPHPHIGLQTVTWLLDGEVVHRDSLGSEQPIRPGQLNLMTAGRGVAHAEETPASVRSTMHGLQLWVAQPEATRWGDAAFEHHASLPEVEVDAVTATVLVGSFAGATSPARVDTPLVGADVVLRGAATIPLTSSFEHAVAAVSGPLRVDGIDVPVGTVAYLGGGRQSVDVVGEGRALLLGGEPFEAPLVMWWNFVGRTRDEIDDARRDWAAVDEARFGPVRSTLPRIPAPA